ncbi:MAG: WD40 repeat domain-containing protein [Planctomycetota bacterium]|jgi:WD40 repeat protein
MLRALPILLLLAAIPDTSPRVRRFTPDTLGLVRNLSPHREYVYDVAFGRGRLATCGRSEKIVLYDTRTWEPVRTLEGHSGTVWSLAFQPGGDVLVSGGADGVVRMWDGATGRDIRILQESGRWVKALAFSPDGKTIAAGGDEGTIRLWDAAWGDELHSVAGHRGSVEAIAFSPDGKTFASGATDAKLLLWQAETGKEIWSVQLSGAYMGALVFSADGKTVYGAGTDQAIHVFSARNGREIATMTGHEMPVLDLELIHGGRYLVSAGGQTLRMWDTRTNDEVAVLKHHTEAVNCVAAGGGGQYLASGSSDMQVKIWGYVPGGMASVKPKGFLGVSIVENADGPAVQTVHPGTAAAAAGLLEGDVFVRVAGLPVKTVGESITLIGRHFAGDEVEIVVRRNGEEMRLTVVLRERPESLK